MTLSGLLVSTILVIAGLLLVTVGTHLAWRGIGLYRIRRAGPRRLRASRHLIWRRPDDVASRDLAVGPGGPTFVPVPPFRFLEEHLTGSHPCVAVLDGRGRRWRVKWGPEVRSEAFAVRVVWACGYFAEVTHFLAAGHIEGARDLQRAAQCLDEDCRFVDARFELEDPRVRKHFEEHSWAWHDNPFVGTPELQGLKLLVMLLSNWDTKDQRDVARGSNTAIFECRRRLRREAHYLISDWGGSMGRWGGNIVVRGRWDAEGFAAQTPQFVTGVENGVIRFGYAGQRTADVAEGITVDDVRWLVQFLGVLRDDQIRRALEASGGMGEEIEAFTKAIRERIRQLQEAAVPADVSSGRAEPGGQAADPMRR